MFVRRLDHFLLGSSVCRSSWPVGQVADHVWQLMEELIKIKVIVVEKFSDLRKKGAS